MKAVLVVVLKDGCGACSAFKTNDREILYKQLKSVPSVNLIELTSDSLELELKNKSIHPQLGKYILWYPSFNIFTYSSWNDHSSNLKGLTRGAVVSEDGSFAEIPSQDGWGATELYSWVLNCLKNSIFLTEIKTFRSNIVDPFRMQWMNGSNK